jgi:hypothetical protein
LNEIVCENNSCTGVRSKSYVSLKEWCIKVEAIPIYAILKSRSELHTRIMNQYIQSFLQAGDMMAELDGTRILRLCCLFGANTALDPNHPLEMRLCIEERTDETYNRTYMLELPAGVTLDKPLPRFRNEIFYTLGLEDRYVFIRDPRLVTPFSAETMFHQGELVPSGGYGPIDFLLVTLGRVMYEGPRRKFSVTRSDKTYPIVMDDISALEENEQHEVEMLYKKTLELYDYRTIGYTAILWDRKFVIVYHQKDKQSIEVAEVAEVANSEGSLGISLSEEKIQALLKEGNICIEGSTDAVNVLTNEGRVVVPRMYLGSPIVLF